MKTGYDATQDFAPLTMAVNFPNVLVVHAGTGIKTFAEFVETAKRQPGKLDFASTGPASASHLAGELLNAVAGIDTVHVPYKGARLLSLIFLLVAWRPGMPRSQRLSSISIRAN